MTHKEKQGLTALGILLAAILAAMWVTGRSETHMEHKEQSYPSPTTETTADTTATQLHTITTPEHSDTSPAHRGNSRNKRKATIRPKPQSGSDRPSPLDNPVNTSGNK